MTKKILFLSFIVLSFFQTQATPNFASNLSLAPTLSNFRIEQSHLNRIYFDSSEPITATTFTGFEISTHRISAIVINGSETTGHYFRTSSPFNFWNNTTISFNGGSNLADADGTKLNKFVLQHVINNISEPTASKNYYISLEGNDSNNGTSESSAWRTIGKAAKEAKAGSTVWIKAGNYGNEQVLLENSGTVTNPIKFIGYKNSPGDIDDLYYSYGDGSLDASEMPMLRGTSNSGNAFAFSRKSFIIVKNIQLTKFYRGFYTNHSSNVHAENILTLNFDRGIVIDGGSLTSFNSRLRNCLAINSGRQNFNLNANNTLIENCKSYADLTKGDPCDYYFAVKGENNIIKNNYAKRVGDLGHFGHAMSVAGDSYGIQFARYNLIENFTSVNIVKAAEARHYTATHNVFRGIKSYAEGPGSSRTGGIMIRDDASYNVFENLDINTDFNGSGITFFESTEAGDGLGHYNIIRNSIFRNNKHAIVATSTNGDTRGYNNEVINCTFNNIENLFRLSNSGLTYEDNSFLNNNVTGFTRLILGGALSGWKLEYNNFYNSFSKPSGTGNFVADPKYINESQGNFRLQPTSGSIDKGKSTNDVQLDFDGIVRPQGGFQDVGAYEYQDTSTTSIDANAGSDVEICEGEGTTLTGSGNGNFLWSTGETTASITVNPTETITYTLTVYEGDKSETDDIIVTVNELPSVDLGDDISICEPGEITLVANGTGDFLWSTGETGSSIVVNPSSTTTYSVTASNSLCSTTASDEIVITIQEELVLDAGEDVTLCDIDEVTLTATGTGDFLWSTGETGASITVNPTVTTEYTVEATLGDCSITDKITVIVNELPSVNLGDDISICELGEVTLTATGVGNFLWSTGETGNSIVVNPTSTTTYSVVASNDCGTNASDEIIVNVGANLSVEIGDDVLICEGESVTLTATGTGDFIWSNGEVGSSITVSPSETTNYTVTLTSAGCSVNDDVEVTVNRAPSVDLGDDIDLCTPESVVLTATGVGNFLWSTGETGPSITVNPSETTTYSVESSNTCDTSASDEITINIGENLSVELGEGASICEGESITLVATGTGNFLWSTGETGSSITVSPTETTRYTIESKLGDCSVSDAIVVTVNRAPSVDLGDDIILCAPEVVTLTARGTGDFLWSTGETTASIQVNPTTTTTYSVVASSLCDSDARDEITINIGESLSVEAGDDVLICEGESVTLTATGTGSFLWNTGEVGSSITVSPDETSTYTVTATSGSCSISDDLIVTVNIAPSVDLGNDINSCSGEAIELTASGTGDFLWSTGETGPSITVNPSTTTSYSVTASNTCNSSVSDEIVVNITEGLTLDAGDDVLICDGETVTLTATGTGDFLWNTGETTASIVISPTRTSNYSVTSTLGNCSVSDDVLVTVNEQPEVSLGEDIYLCSTKEVVLTATGVGNFLWSTGETGSSIIVNPIGTSTYSVVASNSCGSTISDSDEITIFINNTVTADAGQDQTIVLGEETTLTASGGTGFLWSTGETTASITVSPTVTTDYSVEVTDGECSDVDTVTVTVNEVNIEIQTDVDPNICKGDEVTLYASGAKGVDFVWSTGEVAKSITVSPDQTTTYSVSVTSKNNTIIQSSSSIEVNVNDCTTLESVLENFKAFPNPTENTLNVALPPLSRKIRMSLVSIDGKIIYNKDVASKDTGLVTQIDVSSIPKGVYFLRIQNEILSETKKIIVI